MKVFSTVDGPSVKNSIINQTYFFKRKYVPNAYQRFAVGSESALALATAFRIARGREHDIHKGGSAVAESIRNLA